MKTYGYLLLCLFLFSCGQTQTREENTRPDTSAVLVSTDSTRITPGSSAVIAKPETVEEIKRLYAVLISKLQQGLLDSISIKYNCNEERRGTVTYYSEKGSLLSIKHSYSEYDHFSAVDQYFINQDRLFFAHFNQVSWSFESGQAAEGATKDAITEQRLYIANDKPILCLEKKYVKRSHASDNPLPQQVQNKEVACKPLKPVLKDFSGLLAFRQNSDHSCLKK